MFNFCFQDQPDEDDLSDIVYDDEIETEVDDGVKAGPLTLKELFDKAESAEQDNLLLYKCPVPSVPSTTPIPITTMSMSTTTTTVATTTSTLAPTTCPPCPRLRRPIPRPCPNVTCAVPEPVVCPICQICNVTVC